MAYDYDKQIAELTEHPGRIPEQWVCGRGLFQFLSTDSNGITEMRCGCPTMIRNHRVDYCVYVNGQPDEELTQQVVDDERLPIHDTDIGPEHLPVFKEWQQRIDALGRK